MLPLASQYNLRLILVNRRDYPGSSPYSDEDRRNISNSEDLEAYEAFFVARASEFAKFTEWIITHETIPKADWKEKDRSEGLRMSHQRVVEEEAARIP